MYCYVDMNTAKGCFDGTDANGVYAKGSLECFGEVWFHGELSRDEAEHTLGASGSDCFLVRQSQGYPCLSLLHRGKFYHLKVEYGAGWYRLEGLSSRFSDLRELVSHYHTNPISNDLPVKLVLTCRRRLGTQNGGVNCVRIHTECL